MRSIPRPIPLAFIACGSSALFFLVVASQFCEAWLRLYKLNFVAFRLCIGINWDPNSEIAPFAESNLFTFTLVPDELSGAISGIYPHFVADRLTHAWWIVIPWWIVGGAWLVLCGLLWRHGRLQADGRGFPMGK
jgi:hypothetical protein